MAKNYDIGALVHRLSLNPDDTLEGMPPHIVAQVATRLLSLRGFNATGRITPRTEIGKEHYRKQQDFEENMQTGAYCSKHGQ
jgi:hypothetical protein